MARPKKVAPIQGFPDECCGICRFAHNREGQIECFANPPVIYAEEDDTTVYVRSVAVDAHDPVCVHFRARMSA